ncbi:unnamed protein product (macronuclear) [Paramecium tetraurelia]|uniref:Uncharacterized protein n=1 Tax=Paramecium tetraurelia TaxID=5888 RepID=A0EA79_PARTE|nr:uncharacterized protein GSPATT00024928001 [Paramecium tetraurelia]CAK92196.1 unnamed protein product [Paramecium tetraurelia]|eukprot:XP_001459593.1 hypothetical protein (macronuclear) [Paramecium tetraurelia strain d4-2]
MHQEENEKLFEGSVKLKLIDESNKQHGGCQAIAFNSTGTLLLTDDWKKKNIWSFKNGKMELLKRIDGADTTLNCVVFSKKQNSFIYSDDASLSIWKQQDDNDWIYSDPQTKHKNAILCITLNEQEDVLFAGGADFVITVWKVDLILNQLTYVQSLQKHTFSIFALSLNFSENQLVSCGQEIIIWQKNNEQLWEFGYVVNQSTQQDGSRIKFLDDNQFIWAANTQESNKIFVFEHQDGYFQENEEKTIQLNNDNAPFDLQLFPIVYNKQKNAIFFKHKRNLYILRKLKNGDLKIVEVFSLNAIQTQGNVTQNGDYLVEWNETKQGFSTYEIVYQ